MIFEITLSEFSLSISSFFLAAVAGFIFFRAFFNRSLRRRKNDLLFENDVRNKSTLAAAMTSKCFGKPSSIDESDPASSLELSKNKNY